MRQRVHGVVDLYAALEVATARPRPEDLETLMHHFGIEGTVAVQARGTLEETAWLLGLADKHPLIRGVVGWVPLTEGAAKAPAND